MSPKGKPPATQLDASAPAQSANICNITKRRSLVTRTHSPKTSTESEQRLANSSASALRNARNSPNKDIGKGATNQLFHKPIPSLSPTKMEPAQTMSYSQMIAMKSQNNQASKSLLPINPLLSPSNLLNPPKKNPKSSPFTTNVGGG